MIFITVGSQKFQFNRLLKEIDKIIENKDLRYEIFAQTGYCTYKPKNFKYKNFLSREEFSEYIDKCKILLTHGGTGAIIGGVKKAKKVIAIPRDKKFNEHVDNHQYEIVKEFSKMGLIYGIYDIEELNEAIESIEEKEFKIYVSNTEVIIGDIEEFINEF